MLNWIVIGIGDITRKRVIPGILAEPRSHLYGVVTRDPGKAAAYNVKSWTRLEDALDDSSIDAVYVASPVYLHSEQTIMALRAGKHVLCEKPVAMDYQQASEMQRVAEETGKTLGIAYYRRMYPKVRRAMELLEAGVIGKPVLAEINCRDWFNDEAGTRTWLLDPAKSGGGPLYDIASHRIDLLNFFFDAPARAAGFVSNLVHLNRVEDNATVLVDYESGVRGIVDVRWHCRIPSDEFRITGIEGTIDLSPLNGPGLVYPGGSEQLPPDANLHFQCIENFVSAVLEGAPLAASGKSSLATSLITGWVTNEAAVPPPGFARAKQRISASEPSHHGMSNE